MFIKNIFLLTLCPSETSKSMPTVKSTIKTETIFYLKGKVLLITINSGNLISPFSQKTVN